MLCMHDVALPPSVGQDTTGLCSRNAERQPTAYSPRMVASSHCHAKAYDQLSRQAAAERDTNGGNSAVKGQRGEDCVAQHDPDCRKEFSQKLHCD